MKPPTAADAAVTDAAVTKRPFDVGVALSRIDDAIGPFPKAGLFELAEDGFDSPFEQLVACIISIRTYDEVMLPTARRLFAVAHTPAEILRLTPQEIDELISACTFHEPKAQTIHDIARRAVEEYGGNLPCDEEVLLSLRGVGPKCANLVLSIACDQPRIAVDIHVHRITNRWGYISAPTPEKSLAALIAKLPRDHWAEINRLLVPFGKHICTGTLPKCSTCPVLDMCQQVGVTKHR
ncbi:MAG: endonuclease III [Armatimonadota bacterium]|nr:endonuclease III [Armatimonadota bacterium]